MNKKKKNRQRSCTEIDHNNIKIISQKSKQKTDKISKKKNHQYEKKNAVEADIVWGGLVVITKIDENVSEGEHVIYTNNEKNIEKQE